MSEPSQPLRVLIADDHPPTRAGVRQALEADHCVVVAEVADAHKAIAAADEHQLDVCLLDINMPGNGIAAAREISRRQPGSAIVMLTASRDDDDLFEALRAGASGYLLKDMDPDRLASALRGVLSGEAALPRALVARVLDEFRTRPKRRLGLSPQQEPYRLTSREAEVLQLLTVGLSTEDIASQLFIGQVTVRTHVASVLKKLRVPDRESAIRMAKGHGD